MKILIIGSQKEWAFENHYVRHLNNLNVTVDFFPAHDIFYTYYYRSKLNKIIFRLGLSRIYDKINRQLLEYLSKNKFDIVWIFKGMEIFPATLKEIKRHGSKLVNFNPDHPFEFSFRGSGNKNVLKGISQYDFHLCYNLLVKRRIENEFKINCAWLPFGYEQSDICIPKEDEEIKRVCFIGNPDEDRTYILSELADMGIPVSVYGNNWDQWIKLKPHYNIEFYPPIYKNSFNTIASKYRLQLNIFRIHNNNSHNMRTFEMPGLACIMVAPNSEEHRLLFNDGSEVIFYNDLEELKIQTKKLLQIDYKEALKIRLSAYKRSIESGYTYEDRAKEVLEHFKELLIFKKKV